MVKVYSSRMAWVYLLVGSVLEIGWAVGLKFSAGFTRPVPSVLVFIGIVTSFILVARAAKTIPIGTAYAVFVGVGAAGTGLIGILALGEPADLFRVFSILVIVIGVIGLKLFST